MKKTIAVLSTLAIIFLYSCSGSDTYRGAWKATDPKGDKFEITFDAKSFTVKDNAGQTSSFNYTQNTIKIRNGVETYGIKLDDGRRYIIHFPIADDESKGIIQDDRNNLIYTISRGDYITYEDIYKLK